MDEPKQLKQILLNVTAELISTCRFCTHISTDPEDQTPIACTKYSGTAKPILLNVAACLSCGEYKKNGKHVDRSSWSG